jgi:hypothetical protein
MTCVPISSFVPLLAAARLRAYPELRARKTPKGAKVLAGSRTTFSVLSGVLRDVQLPSWWQEPDEEEVDD